MEENSALRTKPQERCACRRVLLLSIVLLAICLALAVNYSSLNTTVITRTHSSLLGSVSSSNFSKDVEQKTSIVLFWTFNYYSKLLHIDKKDMVTFDCGVRKCAMTGNRRHLSDSDVVIFNPRYSRSQDMPSVRPPGQRWAIQTRESPVNERIGHFFNDKINWTITYHHKSDIPLIWGYYIPTGKYEEGPFYIPDNYRSSIVHSHIVKSDEDLKSLVGNKTHKALWIVSNCKAERKNYVKQLQKYGIQVDIFGACGKKDPCKRNTACLYKMFAKYKFYIAFENSHCEDYISEKLWKSLYGNMLPIVMGATITNYQKRLPPNSFLHVDNFTSAQNLAQFVRYLDTNDTAYLLYHQWRKLYEIVPVTSDLPQNVPIWVCDMCKKIDDPPKPAYRQISSWWNKSVMCPS